MEDCSSTMAQCMRILCASRTMYMYVGPSSHELQNEELTAWWAGDGNAELPLGPPRPSLDVTLSSTVISGTCTAYRSKYARIIQPNNDSGDAAAENDIIL